MFDELNQIVMNLHTIMYRTESYTIQKILLFVLEIYTHPTSTLPEKWVQERGFKEIEDSQLNPPSYIFRKVIIFKLISFI